MRTTKRLDSPSHSSGSPYLPLTGMRGRRLLKASADEALLRPLHLLQAVARFEIADDPRRCGLRRDRLQLPCDPAEAPSSTNERTLCFSVQAGRGKATWRKPSDRLRFKKAARCCIAKPTSCSMSLPRQLQTALARNIWNRWPPFRCSSLQSAIIHSQPMATATFQTAMI